jgi:chitinase
LLDEVRSALDVLGADTGRHFGLTAALPCGPSHISNIDIPYINSVLDELHLMTYDFHGSWSTVTGAATPMVYQGWGPIDFSVHDCVRNWMEGEFGCIVVISKTDLKNISSIAIVLNSF